MILKNMRNAYRRSTSPSKVGCSLLLLEISYHVLWAYSQCLVSLPSLLPSQPFPSNLEMTTSLSFRLLSPSRPVCVAQLVLGLKPRPPYGQPVGCHTIKGNWFAFSQWLSNGSSSSAVDGILHLPSSMLLLCLAKSHVGLVYSAQLLWNHVCIFLASGKYCFLDIGKYLWLL